MTTKYLQTVTDRMAGICRIGYVKKDGSFQPFSYYLRANPTAIRIDNDDTIKDTPQGRVINKNSL